jgi:hypothetical protein
VKSDGARPPPISEPFGAPTGSTLPSGKGPVDLTGVESSFAKRTKSVEQDDSTEDDERAQRA